MILQWHVIPNVFRFRLNTLKWNNSDGIHLRFKHTRHYLTTSLKLTSERWDEHLTSFIRETLPPTQSLSYGTPSQPTPSLSYGTPSSPTQFLSYGAPSPPTLELGLPVVYRYLVSSESWTSVMAKYRSV